MGRKKSDRIKLRDKAEALAKKYVKIRDNYTCQKCGKVVAGQNCHGSHVKSKGAYPRLRCDVENMKVLCSRCHRWWWHIEPTDATNWFKEKFPSRYEYLEEAKLNQSKIKLFEYEEMIEDLQDRLVGLDMGYKGGSVSPRKGMK
jgi:5-methylcytosine-specific restriction endonuclease McrA